MTAGEIIREIRNLAPGEQARVVTFVRGLDRSASRLNGRELTVLAEELVQARDPVEAESLTARLVAGFYGEESSRA